jgi:radical SAM superfamily enzyme YgiQ (UPF0313 family)
VKVALLLSPSEHTLHTGLSLPPGTLGVLTAYQRAAGHTVDQYDLDTDLLRAWEDGVLRRADLEFLYDKERVLGYLGGRADPDIDRFCDVLLSGKPLAGLDVVGVSLGGSFSWMPIHSGFLLARFVQNRFGVPVAIGGNNIYYLTLFQDVYRDLWNALTRAFRFIVVGPGHRALDEFARHAREPGWPAASMTVDGLVVRERDGRIAYAPKARAAVLRPDFHGLDLSWYQHWVEDESTAPDPDKARAANTEHLFKWPPTLVQYAQRVHRRHPPRGRIPKLVIPYTFNYHCPYACAFCAESDRSDPLVIGEAERVVADLEYLSGEYDTPYFSFYNNYFNLSKSFVKKFCAEVARRRLRIYWQDCARFNNLDVDLLTRIRDSGCQTLWFGMETGGERLMKAVNKRLTVERVEAGLELCRRLGIWANLEMIVGFPHESMDDFARTVRFLHGHRDLVNYFQANRYFVVPSSTMGRQPEAFGMSIVRDLYTYESLLARNLAWFRSGRDLTTMPNNFDIYGFDEVGGRDHAVIRREGRKRLTLLHDMQRPEFYETRQMLRMLDSIVH